VVHAAVQNRWKPTFLLTAALLSTGWCQAAEPAHRLLGQNAPNFALKATSGANFRLSEYRGDVVLVAFWSSACGQCSQQLVALSRLVDTYRSAGLGALAVNVEDKQSSAVEYAFAHPVSFPVLLDPEKDVARRYRVDNLPMLMLVDRAGVIRFVHRNYVSGSDALYIDQIKTLLDE
jgi:peroxiredoxin